jgi:hypothetical protein
MAKTGLAMEAIKLKECSCCGEEKEYSAFHKSKQAKDGLLTQCIACYRIKRAKFREVHKGEINARERKKHMMNRERNLARKEKWRAANPEKVKEMEKRSNDKRHRTIKGRLNIVKIKQGSTWIKSRSSLGRFSQLYNRPTSGAP